MNMNVIVDSRVHKPWTQPVNTGSVYRPLVLQSENESQSSHVI